MKYIIPILFFLLNSCDSSCTMDDGSSRRLRAGSYNVWKSPDLTNTTIFSYYIENYSDSKDEEYLLTAINKLREFKPTEKNKYIVISVEDLSIHKDESTFDKSFVFASFILMDSALNDSVEGSIVKLKANKVKYPYKWDVASRTGKWSFVVPNNLDAKP